MFETVLLALYILLTVVVGIKVSVKVRGRLMELGGVLPEVSQWTAAVYGILAILLAVGLEIVVVLGFGGSVLRLMVALAFAVGPIEEGVKVLPFLLDGREKPARWRLTLNTALMFALMESSLYGAVLLLSGNLIGALFRIVVIVFHVAWTAIALEGALNESLMRGYLKASLLHSLYDAPALLAIAGAGVGILLPLTFISGAALLITCAKVDDAFEAAYSLVWDTVGETQGRGAG
jgi:RsiW-degrading membrane proteinase PrsW (M82 family)